MFSNNYNEVTGSIVENPNSDDASDNSALSNQNPTQIVEELEQEMLENEDNYEVYEYYEYGGECSYKIKKAEDDVNDILKYSGVDEDRYNSLKQEYNEKLDALKDNYEYQIEDAKQDYDRGFNELQKAQDELQELQEICAY